MKCVKCDRCGELMKAGYDGNASACIYMRNPDDGRMNVEVADLCQRCTCEMQKWLRGRDE